MSKSKSKSKSKKRSTKRKNTKLKTAKNVRESKHNSPAAAAVDKMKREYAKGKAELKRQSEQEESERPENYATDTIEDKAEGALSELSDAVYDAVDRSSSNRRRNKQGRNKQERNKSVTEKFVPQQREHPQTEVRQNAPKTNEQCEQTVHNDVSSHAPKTRDKYAEKSSADVSSNAPKTREHYEQAAHSNVNRNAPKTREQYQRTVRDNSLNISDKTSVEGKSDNINVSHNIKTKENYTQSIVANSNSTDKAQIPPKQRRNAPKTREQVSTIEIKSDEIKSDVKADKARQNAARSYAENKIRAQNELRYTNDSQIEVAETRTMSNTHKSDMTLSETANTFVKSEDIPRINTVKSDLSEGKYTDVSPSSVRASDNIKNTDKPKKYRIKTRENYIAAQREKAVQNSLQKTAVPEQSKISDAKISYIKNKLRRVKSEKYSIAASSSKKLNRPKTAVTGKMPISKTEAVMRRKAAKKALQTARQTAERSAQAAKKTAQVTADVTRKAAQVIAEAVKAIISAIAALGGTAAVIVALVLIIAVAAIAESPFGVFLSEDALAVGDVSLSQIIAEYNVELTQAVEDIELSVAHTNTDVVDNQTDPNVVIAVFAVVTAGTGDNTAQDVVVFDSAKSERLKEFFRAANTVEYTLDDSGINMTVTITGMTKDELMDAYALTPKQREAVEDILANTELITASSHTLVITDANAQSVINNLPLMLLQERKNVVKAGASLVGKVNYFWGGKSSCIGWDSQWGQMRRVTAEGSPSSGTLRAYGLDCSGFVTWAFHNAGFDESAVGYGTSGQKANSTLVSSGSVQIGDLAFFSSYTHVGIVVGRDENGNILVMHCSSGRNNVVITTAASSGFTVFRRPNCYR